MKKKSFLILTLLLPLLNFAQDSYEYENPVLLTDTIKLNEIIIQASKTEDNLQEIQAATTLITLQDIQEQNLNSLPELSARVPNLFMPDYGSRLTSPIYIRGIGSKKNDPSVGLYIDNVPYFDKGSFNFEFFDLEKIEVLRGPQGTLYGRNTMGGIINVFTPDPKFNSTASLKVDYGNYNSIKTNLSTNQKISDKVALIIGGGYAHSDGYFTNTFNDTQADKFDVYNGKIKLLYTPTNRFKTILSVNFEKMNQNGYPYAIYNLDTQEAGDVNYNQVSSYDRNLLSVGLSMVYRLNNVILSSSTSFQHMDDNQGIDQDFTPASLFWVTQDRAENTWVEEFTVRSQSDSKINWLAGIFAFRQSSSKEVGLTYGADAIPVYHLPGPMSYTKWYDEPTTGAAAFGQVSYPIGKFKATFGIRADYESATFNYDYEKYLNGNSIVTDAIDNQLEFTQILPKASISYHPTENITFFTTIGKGYKVGGFNTSFDYDEDGNPLNDTYNPETSINYEMGIKSVCMNNRLMTNLNLFYIDWRNQQISQTPPSGIGSGLVNAARSESKGLELEMRFLVNRNLTIWGAYGYTDGKFIDYKPKVDIDYSGNFIPYIPKSTLNLGGNYTVNINKKVRNATLTVNYQRIAKLFWNDSNLAYQDAYGILNGRLNFHTKKLDFGVWGKNILDANYNAYYFEAMRRSYTQAGKPASYGVFLNFNI